MIIDHFSHFLGPTSQDYLFEIVKEVEEIRGKVASIARQYAKLLKPSSDMSEKVRTVLTGLIEKQNSDNISILLEYQRSIFIKPPRGTMVTNLVRNLTTWRQAYLNSNVGLNNNSLFEFRRQGNAADLYEMWCFFEICAAITRQGFHEVVQQCMIQRGQENPQFRFGEDRYVYFDNRTLDFLPLGQPITTGSENALGMPGMYVEWFIKNLNDYGQSVCLDTKYGRWESREILKVPAYMMNFGINNGVVIINDTIRESASRCVYLMPGLAQIKFPRRPEDNLWIASMFPGEEYEQQNSLIADRLVVELFGDKSTNRRNRRGKKSKKEREPST